MPDISVEMTLGAEVEWEQVYSKDFPEAGTYNEMCTHEDYAFLVDPFQLVMGVDWVKMAKEDLPNEIIAKYTAEGATPLRLKIYIGTQKVLFGAIEYPAIRVESWHHGSPIHIIIVALVIGALIGAAVMLIFLAISEEIPWIPAAAGVGLGILILGLLLLGGLKAKKVIKKFKER